MEGARRAAARDAALGLVARLNEADHLSTVSFASDMASDIHVHRDGEALLAASRHQIGTVIGERQTRG